jgi:hydrogenase expression/formation protein HypC
MGLPMQVVECGFGAAICQYGTEQRRIDMMLVGEQPAGTWVLVFIDAAREVISPESAERINNALASLDSVMAGGDGNVDALFADIIAKRKEAG